MYKDPGTLQMKQTGPSSPKAPKNERPILFPPNTPGRMLIEIIILPGLLDRGSSFLAPFTHSGYTLHLT